MTEKPEVVFSEEDPSLYFAPTTIKNCFLNWLVPGLGYWLTGRKKTGLIMAGALYSALIFGLLLGGDLYNFRGEGTIRMIGSYCQMGMGVPYFLCKLMLDRASPLSLTYDYGTNYFLIAGMLNWLAVMDIFDISVKRK